MVKQDDILSKESLGSLFDCFWDFHNIPDSPKNEDSLRFYNSRLKATDPASSFFFASLGKPQGSRQELKKHFLSVHGTCSLDELCRVLEAIKVNDANELAPSQDQSLADARTQVMNDCINVCEHAPGTVANAWTDMDHLIKHGVMSVLENLWREASPSFVGKEAPEGCFVNPAIYFLEWRINSGT